MYNYRLGSSKYKLNEANGNVAVAIPDKFNRIISTKKMLETITKHKLYTVWCSTEY